MTTSHSTSRRSFLRSAAAAVAAPWMIPAASLGRQGRTAPSERITLGVIGVKNMGLAHVNGLLPYGAVQLLAICDVDARVREAAVQRVNEHYAAQSRDGTYTGCVGYNEYEALLARPDIDAVIIAVPDHWHAIMAIDACRAGKDVYCEKPLSLTIRQANEMVRAAHRYARVLQTGSQQRSSREFRHACELVRNGCIGDVKSVHVEIGPCAYPVEMPAEPTPPWLDYERWLGPAPWAPFHPTRIGNSYLGGWRRCRDYSGGKMTDWGAHHFDIVQWGLGMDASGPVEIVPPPARPPGPGWPPKEMVGPCASPADPTWGLTFIYDNGVTVSKDGSNGIRFVGTEGEVTVNRGFLETKPASLKTHRFGPHDLRLPHSDNHHANWLQCIRTRARPIADVAIGARSVTVCHLGNLALWLGRPIKWNPVQEEILGDEAAARWLDRPMRPPYRLHG